MLLARSVSLESTLDVLAARRPVFHSEADFQFALAWEVQKQDSGMEVYLETRPAEGVHLDLAFERDGHFTALELKYLTRSWSGPVKDQQFDLKNHSAHDLRRYDVVKDITRIEKFTALRPGSNGAVVVLTNDPAFSAPTSSSANDAAFRIHEGARLEGARRWLRAPVGVGVRDDLELSHSYELHWSEYSIGTPSISQLIVEIPERDLAD
jgi:hypothetical protein